MSSNGTASGDSALKTAGCAVAAQASSSGCGSARTGLLALPGHLERSPLTGHSPRTYLGAVRACLTWLQEAPVDGDPLNGKGGTVRTVLLDDRGYVALLRLYLARAGYTAGPLFRASINGSGGPLSYDAAHHRRKGYCSAAGVGLEIHQLRHAHATELTTWFGAIHDTPSAVP